MYKSSVQGVILSVSRRVVRGLCLSMQQRHPRVIGLQMQGICHP
jgi:hypothetical protein